MHNIRWGELVAGLLIVVCSIGLVKSLWSTLQDAHRVIPSLIFLTANAAIFAAGFYTLAKWKLRHTSRAVLLIATLLVPLSVLAGLATANLSKSAVSLGDPITLLAILCGAAINIGLLHYAGRALFGSARSRAFALAVATPAALIPLVPATLRAFEAKAGWIVLLASVAVAIAIALFQQPWRFVGKPRRLLTVASRHQWSFLFVASFSFVALAITTAYLGKEFKASLWYAIIIASVPVISTLAIAAHSIAIRSTKQTHQFIGKLVSILCLGLLMLTLPLLGYEPNWLWLWAVTTSFCFAGLSFVYRKTPWLVISSLPLCVATLISSTWMIGNAEWSSLTWPRRLIGGEPMLTAGLFAILSSLGAWRYGKGENRRPLAMLSASWFVIASLIAATLVFLPESWLGIVPPSVLVVVLVCFTLIASITATLIGTPSVLTVSLSCLVAGAVFHPLLLAGDFAIAGSTTWMRTALLATSILSGLCLVFERLEKPWAHRFLARHKLAPSSRRILQSTTSWQFGSAILCSVAVTLSAFEIAGAPVLAMSVAGIGAAILLICGDRLRDQVWVIASQLATLVVGAAFVHRYDSEAFYSLGDWYFSETLTTHPLWNWSLVFSVLGFVWIGLREVSRRRWFPLDISPVRIPLAPDDVAHFPACWFAAIATVLLVVGSVCEFAPLLFQRVSAAAVPYASFHATEMWLPLLGFLVAIGVTSLLSWMSRHENTTSWRSMATLARVALLLWGSSLCVSLLDITDGQRLVLAASPALIAISVWQWLSTRKLVTTSPITNAMGLGVLIASSISVMTYDWLRPLTASLSPDTFASVGVSLWWLFVSAGLLISSLKRNKPNHARLSAMIAPVASTMAVPVFTDLHWTTWFQVIGLATFAWATIAKFASNRFGATFDKNDLPTRNAMDGAWLVGVTIGMATAGLGLASLIAGPGLLEPMLNPVSCILVATTAGIATIRGVPLSTSLQSSNRHWISWPLTIAWPLAITMLAGQVAWLASPLFPQLHNAPTTIAFTLLTIAAITSLYRYAMLRSPVDAWHSAGLAVFGLVAVESTSFVPPAFSLALVGILGMIVSFQLAYSRTNSEERRTRIAVWFVIAAGCWSLHHIASPVRELEQSWTYMVAWAAGWTIVWHFVIPVIARQLRGEAGTANSKAVWPEFAAMIVILTLGESLAHLAGFAPSQSPVQITSLFLIRCALLQTSAMTLWLRARDRAGLAIAMSVAVVWLGAATVHIGEMNELPWATSMMCAVMVCSFVSAMIALSVTPIVKIHRFGSNKLGVVDAMSDSSHSFAALFPLILSAVIAAISALIMLMLRMPISTIQITIGGIAISAVGVGEISERVGRVTLQRLAIAFGLLSMYFWASLPTPDQAQPLVCGLMRWFVLSVSLIPTLLWGLPRLSGEAWATRWSQAVYQSTIAVGAIGVGSLCALLGLEAAMKFGSGVPSLPMPLVIAVGLSIGLLSVLAAIVSLASGPTLGSSSNVPKAMKLELDDSKRSLLLIAAQVLGVLAWLHIYFCKPHFALFGLRAYWPYIVMVLAFVSVGAVEWVKRRGDELIAKTLHQTSLYLPLIPAVGLLMSGIWITPVAGMLRSGPSLSLVLTVAAGYYVLLSRMREGWMPRVLLVVFANSAVWSLVAKNPEWSFLQHPQLWLIPPALCVLAMAQFCRNELDAKLVATIRYAATIVIYVSSTADMMLQQIGTTLWGPMILIMLALTGMLAGVVLRIRPFLYLGTVFVLLGVTSMVWHAQRSIDQVWPWWAFGITMGILILAGLMSLEKNKGKLQELAARLNSWES